jgi:putative alpha-1,2-mannosidase
MGHTFPGATALFGMVQLSPQTNFEVMFNDDGSYNGETYEYCTGYQHRDSTHYNSEKSE